MDKQNRILDTASELFATRPFHKVLLSDVARLASVGKGTLYLYFKSKDDLYIAVLFREFTILVDKLRETIAKMEIPPDEQIAAIISELFHHMIGSKSKFEILGAVIACPKSEEWRELRTEMWTIIETVILRGVEHGMFKDKNPRLSAQYITGLVRSISLFRPEGVEAEELCRHAQDFVLNGLRESN